MEVHYPEDPLPDMGSFDLIHVTSNTFPDILQCRPFGLPVASTYFLDVPRYARHSWSTGRSGVFRLGQVTRFAYDCLAIDMAIFLSTVVLAASAQTYRGVQSHYPGIGRKLRLNELGVDTEVFRPGGSDEGYVLFVGRLETSKGIDMALDVMNEKGHPFKIVGTGTLETQLRAKAGPQVEFLGPIALGDPRLVEVYQRASLCIFPSQMEGFGLVGLESLACGIPTVLTDVFGILPPAADLAECIPPNDPAALNSAIDKAFGKRSPAWSTEAHATVARQYSLEWKAAELVNIYRDMRSAGP